jgi:hypothetical protein
MNPITLASIGSLLLLCGTVLAQPKGADDSKQPAGPGGTQTTPRGPGGPGGPGGMGGQERKIVKQFDKDNDKKLSAEERVAAREFLKKNPSRGFGGPGGGGPGGPGGPGGRGRGPSLNEPLVKAVDTDKDGLISKAEMNAGIKQFFADADKDKKGSILESQLVESLNLIAPPPPTGAGGPGGGAGGRGGFGPGTFMGPAILAKADANKDGKLTLDELTAGSDAIFKDADKDKNDKLDDAELTAAIATLMPARGGPGGGPGGMGGMGGQRDPAKPGPQVKPTEVKIYGNESLYDPAVLRTIFITFDNKKDWEAELAEFNNTDVDIPATVVVDGKSYANVGIHFRGMSSFGMVPAGYKRSLNLAFDYADEKQRLLGYKTLNLLNSNGDPSFLSTVIYSHIARQHIPAPKANLVKVVINGESWGVYVNAQQFNKEFLVDNYKTDKGARWKVSGSPNGQGGLEYLGDNVEQYKQRYDLKTKDNDKDWQALIELCRVINKTPVNKLEEALAPILDIDGALWFLALDIGLMNSDGFWTRASDYSIYRDPKGVFHIIPHDMNEAFHAEGGPGGGPGGRGGAGGAPGSATAGRGSPLELDPLMGLDDARKALRSKLLSVPALRARYLQNIKTLAQDSLDWKNLGPVVAQYRSLIEKEVEADTRKLSTLDAFRKTTADTLSDGPVGRGAIPLRNFAEERRKYLLNYVEKKSTASAQ